jgi:hypothetical protein
MVPIKKRQTFYLKIIIVMLTIIHCFCRSSDDNRVNFQRRFDFSKHGVVFLTGKSNLNLKNMKSVCIGDVHLYYL